MVKSGHISGQLEVDIWYVPTQVISSSSFTTQRHRTTISHGGATSRALRLVIKRSSIQLPARLWEITTMDSVFHPSGVGKWVPASAGKAKAGMVHSVSGCARGVQVKLWDPLRTRAIPERLRGVFTTRRYTNPRLPLPLKPGTACTIQFRK